MRRAVVLGLGLLLCLVGVIVFAQLFGSGSILFPATVPVKVFAHGWGMPLSNVTVNVYSSNGNYTVVTVNGGWDYYPILNLRINGSYLVTASWQEIPPMTRTITVVNASNCVIIVEVDIAQMQILSITFIPWY